MSPDFKRFAGNQILCQDAPTGTYDIMFNSLLPVPRGTRPDIIYWLFQKGYIMPLRPWCSACTVDEKSNWISQERNKMIRAYIHPGPAAGERRAFLPIGWYCPVCRHFVRD